MNCGNQRDAVLDTLGAKSSHFFRRKYLANVNAMVDAKFDSSAYLT